ncbi:MAG: TlpA disulfide reductase family protein [Lutibacter sp.]|nr:TlpA disulfide reductase family protein [Lutibacter sp.]
MKKAVYLLIISLIIISCQKEKTPELVILSGFVKNKKNDTIKLSTNDKYKLYNQKNENINIILNSENRFTDTLNISDGYYNLEIGNNNFILFLKSGNNLNLESDNSKLNISGTGKIENKYLVERNNLDSKLASINYWDHYYKLNENDFLNLADSIYQCRIELIRKHKIEDKRFHFIETTFAEMDREHKFLNYPFTRQSLNQDYIPSKDFPNVFAKTNINDDRLLDIPYFTLMMFSNIANKIVVKNDTRFDAKLDYLRLAISDRLGQTNPKLKEEIAFLTADFTIDKTDSLDLFFKTYKDFTKNEEYLNKITTKYLNLKGISKGKQAPNFEFKNENGELISLADFQGYVIYLDIWATYCKPCLEEIEPSKELQKKLSNQKIKFVNICIESKRESWLNLIKEKEFTGIQLYCTKEDEEKFKESYVVQGIPSYIIIDKEGKIYDINAKRPSDAKVEKELLKIL